MLVDGWVATIEGNVGTGGIRESFQADFLLGRNGKQESKLYGKTGQIVFLSAFVVMVVCLEEVAVMSVRLTSKVIAYLLRKHVGSKITKRKFESTISAVNDDLDSDQGVGPDRTSVRMRCSHERRCREQSRP